MPSVLLYIFKFNYMSLTYLDKIKPENYILLTEIMQYILTLPWRRAIIMTSKFEKLLRAWFCSDRRQISAENRTAHTVHCPVKNKFLNYFQKWIIYNTVNMLMSKKCKKEFFELVSTYEDNNFSPILFEKPYETFVHKNIRQKNKFEFFK